MAAAGSPSLVLATRNGHKLREFSRLLAPAGISITGLPDEVRLAPEDGLTFTDNAMAKARAAAAALSTAVIADDSGIESDALGGAPGVRSARFAGERATDEENLAKLVREAPAGSRLRYVCSLVYVDPACGIEEVFAGYCRGRMAERPAGEGGFGYDPAFVPDGEAERTMAQLSDAEKDGISHRGNAARALAAWLEGRRVT